MTWKRTTIPMSRLSAATFSLFITAFGCFLITSAARPVPAPWTTAFPLIALVLIPALGARDYFNRPRNND
jgi:hypothetical protein